MANVNVSSIANQINVATTESNISVSDDTGSFLVNVTSTAQAITVNPVNTVVTVAASAIVSNQAIRAAIEVANVSGFGNISYDSDINTSNGIIQYVGVSTNDIRQQLFAGYGLTYNNATGNFITEASEIQAQARQGLGNIAPIQYNTSTGVIAIDEAAVFTGKTTDDLAEGNVNLYYTEARVNTNFATKTTDDLTEGSTNLYFSGKTTDALPEGSTNLYLNGAGTTDNLTEGTTNLYLNGAGTTTDLTEGTNLYYTDTRVVNAVENEVIKLKQYSETYYDAGNVSGAVTLNAANGTMQRIKLIGDITNISVANLATGGSITILATQDNTGNKDLTNATSWSNYQWAGGFTQLDPTADSDTVITIFYDGTDYNASVVRFDTYDTFDGKTTTDLPEGANLYYTTARANTALQTYIADATNSPFTFNGNVDVQGNLNYVNVEDLLVNDQSITMNFGNVAQDAMIIVDRVGSGAGANTEVRWNETTDKWTFSNDGSTYNNMLTLADIPAQGVTSVNGFTGPAVTLDTDNIAEGTAKYYATSLFDTDFATKTTTNLTEGTNLYFTDARADARVNLQTGTNLDLSSKSTTDLAEGTNLYYTDGRFDTRLATKSTTDLSEGTNLYYTSARFDSAFTSKDTDDLSEGTTNLYYTDARSRAAVSLAAPASASGGGALAYNSATGAFTFTPAIPGIGLTDLSVTTATPSGDGALAYDDTSGIFTFTPADAGLSDYGNVQVADFLANGFGSNTITTTGDITTTGFFEGDLNGAVTIDVYNNTGVTINKGDAVYLTGGNNGDNPHVALADSDDAAKMPALGIVRENITTASVGQVVTSGEMNDSSHGYTLGADLYIDTTAGGLTTTIPTGEDKLIQKIGKVVSANHIIVQGAFRTNATPNLNEGNIFLGSTTNTSVAVTPSNNFKTTANAFELSNALTNVNSITTESTSGFAINSSDGTIVTSPFGADSTVTETANISGKGYGVFNSTGTEGILTYSGTSVFEWYILSGSTTAGSTTLTITSLIRGIDNTAATLGDMNAGQVIQNGQNVTFPLDAYVVSINAGAGTVTMSQPAIASHTFGTLTGGSFVFGVNYTILTLGDTDWGAIGSPQVTPNNIQTGTQYIINSTGDTDFTLIGASSNGPDTIFTATGSGSGTGTVIATNFPAQGAGSGTGTAAEITQTIVDAGMVDTTTGLVIGLYSDLRVNGGGSDSALNQIGTQNFPFGYPATGPEANDFDIFTTGTVSDYAVGDYSAYTLGQTSVTNSRIALNAPLGITIGESTQLTNRGENDRFKSFGLNMLWDGLTPTLSNQRIQPAILLKSYSDNSQGQTNRSSGAPRLFFSSAYGNINDNPYGAYPLEHQELGRLSFWGSTGTQLNPSSYNVPAYTSVHAADNWSGWGGGVAGNTNVYNAATSNGVNADTYLAYKNGELFLGSNSTKPITLAPASQPGGQNPQNAYSGAVTTWANVHYANPGASTGAKLTVTNGNSSGVGVVGDMELGVFRNDVTNGGSNSSVQNGFTLGSNFYNNLQVGGYPDKSAFIIGNYNSGPVDLTGLSNGDQVTFDNYTGALGTEINGNSYYVLVRPWTYQGSFPGTPFYAQYLIALYTDATYTTPLQLTTGSGAYGSTGTVEWTVAPSVTDREWKFNLAEQSEDLVLSSNGADKVTFTSDQTTFTNIPVMPSHSNVSLPASVAGGIIYVTNSNNKPAYGDGTNWYYYDNTQVT